MMELLGNYYDSGEEETEEHPTKSLIKSEKGHVGPHHSVIVSEKISLENNSISEKIKKKRKLTLSFLPPEILNALTRGDTMKDSDDELETLQSSKGPSIASTTSCQLLSLLPAPSKSTTTSHSIPEINRTQASAPGVEVKDPKFPKSSFSLNYTSVQEKKQLSTSTKEFAAPLKKNSMSTISINSNSKPPLIPSSSQLSFLNNPFYDSEDTGDANDAVNIGPRIISQSDISYNNFNSSSSVGYFEPVQQNSYHDNFQSTSSSSNKKKRDREIEHQLLSGNVSILPGDIVKELNVDRKWDATKYSDQQQREAMIHKEFGLTSQRGLMQPTKQQNRKHQLSSLAIKAAEVELSMLEARGSRMKSKSETQGKYGW